VDDHLAVTTSFAGAEERGESAVKRPSAHYRSQLEPSPWAVRNVNISESETVRDRARDVKSIYNPMLTQEARGL
jgi:hypothetical protein